MKSILDPTVQQEILRRIDQLTPESKALWGKMNVYQMAKHCTLCDDMYTGGKPVKRSFIGRLIGPMVLKMALKDETPFRKNSPTAKTLMTTHESGDWGAQKAAWKDGIRKYAGYNNPRLVHPFFGPVTKEQVGFLAYKHTDHHLRQFGV